MSKPVSTSASEISSQAGEGDFEENILVSTPNQQAEQVLVVQAQNGVNMASGTATMAPSTATTASSTAPSTAPLQVSGPSTMEPIVPIGVQLGQDTPSVIQGARPDVTIEQTPQSTQRYGTLPYIPGLQYTAPLPCTAPLPYDAPFVSMPAMSARPALSMGYYGQGSQFPFVPNPSWMTGEQLLQQQQFLQERQQFEAWRASQAQVNPQPQPQMTSAGPVQVEGDVDFSKRSASATRARPEDQITIKAKAKRATSASTPRRSSASTPRRSPSPKRDYPRGTCTATRPSQASPKRAERTLTPAQDLEAFKADMTSMLSDMLQASLSKFACQFNPSSGGQGDTAPTQTVASEPTVDVASNDDDSPSWGPEYQSEGEIIDSEGEPADPMVTGLSILDNLKMSEEEQRDYDAFSLASVSVPRSSKHPWRALGDSKVSQSQPQDISSVRQARPQAVAKAQSV